MTSAFGYLFNEAVGHYYEVETKMCDLGASGCTRENLEDLQKSYQVPGQDPTRPVENGTIRYVDETEGNFQKVKVFQNSETGGWTNATAAGHIFEVGGVDRLIIQRGNALYVRTVGMGMNSYAHNFVSASNIFGTLANASLAAQNQRLGPQIFKVLDSQMRSAFRERYGQ